MQRDRCASFCSSPCLRGLSSRLQFQLRGPFFFAAARCGYFLPVCHLLRPFVVIVVVGAEDSSPISQSVLIISRHSYSTLWLV